MLVRIQLLMMMMMMKSAATPQTVTVVARSGNPVLLSSERLKVTREDGGDVRWTHRHLVLSLRNNRTRSERHGRRELLSDGSLRLSRVSAEDAGNYSLQVFDPHGTGVMQIHFLLRVEEGESTNQGQTKVSLSVSCFLLLLLLMFFIIVFIVRKRTRRTAGDLSEPKEENVYMPMFGNHSNKRMQLEKEEESLYVTCHPVVSMETHQTEAEDVYV